MSSFWRINVSLNGQFYFRTDNEFISKAGAEEIVRDFRKRFPETDGFKVTLTRWSCSGSELEVE